MNAVAEKSLPMTAPSSVPAQSTAVALTPPELLERALASGAAPETLEKFMNLQDRWEKSQARKAFDNAIAAAKAEIPVIEKTHKVKFGQGNGATEYWHETLAGIARVVDPILGKHGLSYRFRTASDATSVTVTCVVSHRDGYSEETALNGPHDKSGGKNAIQAIGSSVTYLQRYTLKAALGVAASDDDDATAAGTSETLTDVQVRDLDDMLKARKVPLEKFLQWAQQDSLADIPIGQLDACKNAINNYKPGK